MLNKYRKKPVVIEAYQLTKQMIEEHVFDHKPLPWPLFLVRSSFDARRRKLNSADLGIKTLEGTFKVTEGDWIIKGVKGEWYSCKPDIFEMTYDPEPSP